MKKIDIKHDGKNVLLGALAQLVILSMNAGLFALLHFESHYGLLANTVMPVVLRVTASLILIDLWMYFWHRLNHWVPFLWHFHTLHHNDTKVNASTGLRFHAIEVGIGTLLQAFVYTALGITPLILLFYNVMLFSTVIFHHSAFEVRPAVDSWLRKILVTPGMHRTHHSIRRAEHSSNFGSVLPVWDKLFGSYRAKPEAQLIFGLEQA